MVELSSFIAPEAIRPGLEATTKQEVLQELVSLLFAAHSPLGQHLTRSEATQMLVEREKLAATGVGNRVGQKRHSPQDDKAADHAADDRNKRADDQRPNNMTVIQLKILYPGNEVIQGSIQK